VQISFIIISIACVDNVVVAFHSVWAFIHIWLALFDGRKDMYILSFSSPRFPPLRTTRTARTF